MQTYGEYLISSKVTVKALREIVVRLGYKGTSKMVKAKLAEIVDMESGFAYDDAVTENRKRVTRKIADGYKAKSGGFPLSAFASDEMPIERVERKVNNYMRFNGTDKLTPAQWRRTRKAMRKAGIKTIGELTLTFP